MALVSRSAGRDGCGGVGLGDRSGSADLNQDFAGNLGVRGDRECLVDVLKRQYVSDHVLDLRVLIQQRDGGVDLVVEACLALYLLRH
jgi:hypothetical protein